MLNWETKDQYLRADTPIGSYKIADWGGLSAHLTYPDGTTKIVLWDDAKEIAQAHYIKDRKQHLASLIGSASIEVEFADDVDELRRHTSKALDALKTALEEGVL